MPAITCTNCGAMMNTATPVAAGKEVNCPKCGKPFSVPAGEEENPFAFGGNAPAAKTPPSKGDLSGDGAADKKEPAKKGKGMMIGLIAGGVLLLCCCCPGGGTGVWFGWSYFYAPPFDGAWLNANTGKGIRLMGGGRAQVSGLLEYYKPPEPNASWKMIDGKTVQITMDDDKKIPWEKGSSSAKYTFAVSGEHLTLTNTESGTKTTLDRINLNLKK